METSAVFSFVFLFCFATTVPIPTPLPERTQSALSYLHSLNITKMIVDVDAGADDAVGLLLVLAHSNPDYPEIIGVTCTHGNVNVTQVAINVLKTLRLLGLEKKLPVYMGANHSLITTPQGDNYYGVDGFGDVPYPNPPDVDEVEDEHAVNALVRLVNEDPGNIAVVATGPLTNIALATRLNANFRANLKALFWMGGSVQGQGNVKPGVEFNAFADPEANFIVFNTTGCPVVVFPLEACTNQYTSTKWREEVLGQVPSPYVDFMNGIERISLNKSETWDACDPKAMSVVLQPDVVVKASVHNVVTVFQGLAARGALMVDYSGDSQTTPNAVIIEEISAERFEDLCLKNLS